MNLTGRGRPRPVFCCHVLRISRRLMELEVGSRNLKRPSAQHHLFHLHEGGETSSLHLDILRDLKRIDAHVMWVAHPILDKRGLLFESRLRGG